MLGPLVEVGGYVGFAVAAVFDRVSTMHAAAFFMLAIALGMTLSVTAVAQEEIVLRRSARNSDLLRLFQLALLENLGYRQLNTLWRARGVFRAAMGIKVWGKGTRKGFRTAPPRGVASRADS